MALSTCPEKTEESSLTSLVTGLIGQTWVLQKVEHQLPFLQPVSLLFPLSDFLCLLLHHPEYLGRHGLHPDLIHPGLLHMGYLGSHSVLGHLGLHPVCLGLT